jgi:hypothetical protein
MDEVNLYGNNQDLFPCLHESNYLHEMKQNFQLCFNCSSIIYTNELGKKIFPIKPRKYNAAQETATPIFLSVKETHRPYLFNNKESYLKIRAKIVKKMKLFAQNFNLTKKTYFLSLEYFDRICSRAAKFNYTDFLQTALLCVVLAAKFQDDHQNAFNAKVCLGLSNNYTKDELYVLQLLNYDLYAITSYDIVMDIMHTGFLFSDENFSLNKMNVIYQKVEKMLYFFSEKKYYIEMTPIEIALSVIGFIREALGLDAFNSIIKLILMTQADDLKIYTDCLKLFKNCFQIQEQSNQSNKKNNAIKNKVANESINKNLSNNSTMSNFTNLCVKKNNLIKQGEK